MANSSTSELGDGVVSNGEEEWYDVIKELLKNKRKHFSIYSWIKNNMRDIYDDCHVIAEAREGSNPF